MNDDLSAHLDTSQSMPTNAGILNEITKAARAYYTQASLRTTPEGVFAGIISLLQTQSSAFSRRISDGFPRTT